MAGYLLPMAGDIPDMSGIQAGKQQVAGPDSDGNSKVPDLDFYAESISEIVPGG